MKSISKSIAFASLALTLLLSCAREEIGRLEREDGRMELTVTGVLGEYETAEGTKTSLVNTLRVNWATNDIVHVFQQSDGKYLGPLLATAVNGGKVATLTGTIIDGSGTLVFVYSTTALSLTNGNTYSSLDISLANQGADTPFVVYGTAEYSATSITDLVVNFSFATSVVSAYASGLPASTNITEGTLEGAGVNTVCSLNITGGGTPSGNTVGTIEKTGSLGTSNSAGQAMVQFAVPACPSGERECYLIAGKKYVATLVGSNAFSYATAYSVITPMIINATNLSSEKTANCYMVFESGVYKFNATVKGNSDVSVGDLTGATAKVLWESFGTDKAPNEGELIKDVTFSDGYVTFEATANKGNAVIAVKNSGGTTLWSWHIWLTDEPEDQEYQNDTGKMMDRNLGATAANSTTAANKLASYGLHYQWGRKDPFLGGDGISSTTQAASTGSWSVIAGTQTVDYSVQNPTTFIFGSSPEPHDWTAKDDNLWSSTKTMYDPCPPGYRVPDGNNSGVWGKAGFVTATKDSFNNGYNFTVLSSGGSTWYPAAGIRRYSNGSFDLVGSQCYCWSCTPGNSYAYYLSFNSGDVYIANYYYQSRAYGQSVRCLREKN